MKKAFKYFAIVIAALLVIIVFIFGYVHFALPNVGPAEEVKIDYTPERIAHGRYLANSVSACMDCHSTRDFTKFAGPMKEGTLGMGGDVFDRNAGLPGTFYPGNITPAGISRYTDGELVRLITTGVTKEGRAMFPLMPYPYYSRMDTEDIYDIIAYIRSIPSIENNVPVSSPDFPISLIIKTIPQKATPQKRPSPSDTLAYGAYLTNAAGCRECHSQVDKGQVIEASAFGGGREFIFPGSLIVRSSNITADKETGIGSWTKEAFIQRFKIYSDSSYHAPDVAVGEFNTPMPWTMYTHMTPEDLGSIYLYLRTLKPINLKIEKMTASK